MNTDWKGLQRENSRVSNPFAFNFAHHTPELGSTAQYNKYIEICRSPGYRGWIHDQVTFRDVKTTYITPHSIRQAVKQSNLPAPRNTGTFGLCDCVNLEPYDESLGNLQLKLIHGHYENYWQQSFILNPTRRQFSHLRDELTSTCLPLERSPLWHSVVCGTLVRAKDKKIILAQRSRHLPSYWERRDATIGEHMMRKHHDARNKTRDVDPFACSLRGLYEELGIRLALFVFLAQCSKTYEDVIESWKVADTNGEIDALDCIPAAVDDVTFAFNGSVDRPSHMVRARFGTNDP
jgi:hypothetical protein